MSDWLVQRQLGNWLSKVSDGAVNLHYKAEVHHVSATFNNAIRGTIPQIIKLLKDSNSDVQLAGVDAIMRLAEKRK